MAPTKMCTSCKKVFPKTLEFFFKKKMKQTLANGTVKFYDSFRSNCKACYGKKGNERKVAKRCKELGCQVEDYRESWKKQYSKTRTKYPQITHLPKTVQWTLRKWIDGGYVFTTYEQYRIDHRRNLSKVRRKNDYGDALIVTQKLSNKRKIDNITDGYIVGIIKQTKDLSKDEIPQSMIHTKRLLIQLKRHIKNDTRKEIKI